ncbi:NAD(P)/FAD-dependent oxidoreductase [Sphingomonas sp. LaA6.9]|uniref:flavin-containing monooxygenase n=1 Tax=Sphingomonas sp. LaA6.9 TaxID=2919914 RepID=UPI001F501BD4|nr:NAD(P)/FAD-dependent oxidoreductase [Sphingomonas sp. LaA6.9]MCJ8158535.1 NAD(P)/FAD-dependent oxidoreductase [Sphingomonas sp. LaA6.9]
MTCKPTRTPAPDEFDIPSLREKYRQERDKRLRSDRQDQYVPSTADVTHSYDVDPYMPVVARDPISEDLDVVVLGAGFAGILASYHLTKAGVTNFRNIDHAGDFGGVWYWNRYPGIQCDNDAYCYLPLLEETGFMPSKKFADGAEIYEYCKLIARKFDFADKAVFHTLITSLRWDEEIGRWRVGTSRGDEFRARFIIMGCGVLNMPKLPGIPGIEQFKGKLFHSARWDYEYTGGTYQNPVLDKLADKRVAIIGTGATAIQAVPYLARYAKQLYVIQRTPSTVDERPNPPTDPDWAKSLEPGWQDERKANFHRAAMEFFAPGEEDQICDIWTEITRNLAAELAAEGWPQLAPEEFMARREVVDYRVMERLRARVENMVEDKETAESLKPWYRFLCKRPLSSNEFYGVFNQPNVKLIDVSETKGLERLTDKGFVANGVEYEIDCLICASGFEVTSELKRRWGIDVVEGRGGESIYDHWANGPETLHGTMTHGFPNQFFIGYIQGGLNASVTEQFGRQGYHSAHIISEALKRGLKAVEPTKEAQDAYVRHFHEVEIDMSQFQRECTPSYFTNEGQVKAPWALFRSYGPGWGAFQKLLEDWRASGDLEGLELRS